MGEAGAGGLNSRAGTTSTLGSWISLRSISANSFTSVPGRIRQFRLPRAAAGITFSLYPALRRVGVQVVLSIALKLGLPDNSEAHRLASFGSASLPAHTPVSPGRTPDNPPKKARVVSL